MDNNIDLIECLKYIPASQLEYQDWINIGMALKEEGYTVADWDMWSQNDTRYRPGECEKKWNTFNGSASPVTAGTIIQMAKDNGWSASKEDYALEWDSVIGRKDELKVIDKTWIEDKEIHIPATINPIEQIITYLTTLFDTSDIIGYVTETYQHENGRYLPKKGAYDRTAGEIISQLREVENGDIGVVLGDYNEEAGAWIRFNPLDGKGVRNDNVTDFKYALVESDSESLEKQNAILRELELPIACLVYSGGKSLHAIVKVEATSKEDYRKKVDYIYNVCRKNGLEIDTQNKNPSRLSRLPGIKRGDTWQYLLDTNIGKSSFEEWKEYIESINDDLPDPENLDIVWNDMPDLADALIDGVLRQGHKMLIAGPSKAGKSFALIELCCALAEGKKWFGFKCMQSRVMYVNLELDRASCLHRFKDVYNALKWDPKNIGKIDIWNLRGKSIPMDKLAPKLIRRAAKKDYAAIIIDPIYKIITGDENSADQMSFFCNQFDKVCTELGCAVIYCHHHSKGAQGDKISMDRASGSGVFARDPDALLDMIELTLSDEAIKQEYNNVACEKLVDWIERFQDRHSVELSQDDKLSLSRLLEIASDVLPSNSLKLVKDELKEIEKKINAYTAWRLEGTLREFPKFTPVNSWFRYPVHEIDDTGILEDLKTRRNSPYSKNFSKKKSNSERKDERKKNLDEAFQYCSEDGKAKISDLAEYLGISEKSVKNRIDEISIYWRDNGEVGKK